MSLYVLVEGATEKLVYDAWIRCALPGARRVESPAEVGPGAFYVFSHGRYPTDRDVEDSVKDVCDHPGIEHLLVCVDTDDRPSASARRAEVQARVDRAVEGSGMRARNPRAEVQVVAQHWCIETWFLGHPALPLRPDLSPKLLRYLAHYDPRVSDPELMPFFAWDPRDSRPHVHRFHGEYVRELFQNVIPPARYQKTAPGIVLDRAYYDALVDRVTTTGHLPSLALLFETLQRVAAPPQDPPPRVSP